MNPRATQVGHLALGIGHDLAAALYSAATAKEIREARSMTANRTIALFPQELMRDPNSPFLQSAYHDIPWEEPALLRACLRKSQKWTDWRPVEELIQTLLRNGPKKL